MGGGSDRVYGAHISAVNVNPTVLMDSGVDDAWWEGWPVGEKGGGFAGCAGARACKAPDLVVVRCAADLVADC